MDETLLQGACHCGAVRLTLPFAPEKATKCNCSICRRIGGLWGYYRPDEVAVSDPDGQLVGYVQGDAMLTNWHCARCGCTTHWTGGDPTVGDRMGVNTRLMDPAVVAGVRIKRVDGVADTWAELTD